MEDTRIKKIIVGLTVSILLALWWQYRPHTISAITTDITYHYIVQKPKWGSDDTIPFIVALHGNGDSMKNFKRTLFQDLDIDARIIFIRGPLNYRNGHAWPISGAELKRYGDSLAEVVVQFSQNYPGARKPVLIGFSGGGCMAYYQAAVHPDLYSTIIPISGSLGPSFVRETAPSDNAAEIVAMHGKADKIMSFAAGAHAVERLYAMGREAQMVEITGGHLAVFTSGHGLFKEIVAEAIEK